MFLIKEKFVNCKWFHKRRLNQLLASILCNLAMMVTCSSFLWLSPIELWLVSKDSEIILTSDDLSWLQSFVEVSSFLSGIPSGILADRIGRKPVLLTIGGFCFTPWLVAFFSRDKISLYVIRFIQGFSEGVCFAVGPTYVAEIASPEIRAALGGQTVFFMYFGFFYTYCTGSYLRYQHYLYSLSILPLIFFFTFIFMPESPYYYLMKNKKVEAYKALSWLRGNDDITEEFNEIEKAVAIDMTKKGGFKDLFATKSDRRAFLIVQIVNVAAYMTGVPTVSMYASQTFATGELLWFDDKQFTIIMSIILCGTALIASFVADKFGRRKLLIVSSLGIAISNLILTTYYILVEKTDINVKPYSWVLYVGVFGLCLLTNIGVGELVHTIQAEFFPSHTRSIGGGVTTAIATVAIFVSVKVYQPLTDLDGVYLNFVSYTVISLIAAALIIIYVNESTCKTLAEINKDIIEATMK